ncbi:hypothetical protein GIB67_017753, partial [Kingdonia uniflora]
KTSDSMELVLEESDTGNWVYKGEGAANIVLSGYNRSNPHFVGKLYVENVIFPLLGSEHVDTVMHILVSGQFLEAVKNNFFCQRPAWRVDASKVNLLCDFALLISDHSIFPDGIVNVTPCISVEIKPKCEDQFGYMLSDILKQNNVDNFGNCFDSAARTTLTLVTPRVEGESEFMFFRYPSADFLL